MTEKATEAVLIVDCAVCSPTRSHMSDQACWIETQQEPAPQFVTTDSGARANFDSGMVRDLNQGKPRFDLITPACLPYPEQMLTRLASLMARGAEKYGDRNWEKADSTTELSRMRESAFRHFMQWYLCADDQEDHLAAAWFNSQGAEYIWYHMRHPEALKFPKDKR